ncbi:MAG TPA: ABC-2 family transporter protein [Chloroflexota bacterium]|nr:ABC-2 family transporter protein [Chloroflexota bacterium]
MSLLRLVAVFLRVAALNELQYRTNFYIAAVRSAMRLIVGLGGLALVFSHTTSLGGWRAADLLALLGVYYMIDGLIYLMIAPSMNRLMEDVRQGTLDFTLTKPEDAQVLVSVRQVEIWKVTDVGLGAAVLGVALGQIGEEVGAAEALAFGAALLAGAAIVYAFWLMLATLSFWLVRVDNLMVIFQSLYQAGKWPVGIYPGWLRAALTFVVPVAFATTVPAEALAGRGSPATLAGAGAMAVALLVVSRRFWRFGLRHYSGASA